MIARYFFDLFGFFCLHQLRSIDKIFNFVESPYSQIWNKTLKEFKRNNFKVDLSRLEENFSRIKHDFTFVEQ